MTSHATQSDVFDALREERCHQDARFGPYTENPQDIASWLQTAERILNAAKAKNEVLDEKGALSEIRQFSAVGVACLEEHGVVRRGA